MERPTRDRILDAAASVLLEKGVVGATTKEIARAAGCSEALLYKHFADKQELFVAVLAERLPVVELPRGDGDLADDLTSLVVRLMDFFAQSFPMAVSIFGAPELLGEHRDGVRAKGFGPEGLVQLVMRTLAARRDVGDLRADADLEAAARLLIGFAFHRAFLAAYEGRRRVPRARALARRGVDLVLPAITPGPRR